MSTSVFNYPKSTIVRSGKKENIITLVVPILKPCSKSFVLRHRTIVDSNCNFLTIDVGGTTLEIYPGEQRYWDKKIPCWVTLSNYEQFEFFFKEKVVELNKDNRHIFNFDIAKYPIKLCIKGTEHKMRCQSVQ